MEKLVARAPFVFPLVSGFPNDPQPINHERADEVYKDDQSLHTLKFDERKPRERFNNGSLKTLGEIVKEISVGHSSKDFEDKVHSREVNPNPITRKRKMMAQIFPSKFRALSVKLTKEAACDEEEEERENGSGGRNIEGNVLTQEPKKDHTEELPSTQSNDVLIGAGKEQFWDAFSEKNVKIPEETHRSLRTIDAQMREALEGVVGGETERVHT
ncbi:hypothetical protein F0562_022488 [Nyssa sinensis]|uniref:Uncharacterized protein n=1 Tax=Nyssa sinensis TaxID=561372 RepID=A0A5J5BRY0_9ASTE|nr:hypothetical protein F0562_022488 [Nyssa sinensis]